MNKFRKYLSVALYVAAGIVAGTCYNHIGPASMAIMALLCFGRLADPSIDKEDVNEKK